MITISNNFATLESYDSTTGMMRFRFSYSVDVSEAFRTGASRVKVSIYKDSSLNPPVRPNQYSSISEHLSYESDVKNYVSSLRSSLIATGVDDLTSYVDNSVIARGGNNFLPPRRKTVLVPTATLDSAGGQLEFSKSPETNVNFSSNTQAISLDLINKGGIDPSSVTNSQLTKSNSKLSELSKMLSVNVEDQYSYSLVTQIDSSNTLESYVNVEFSIASIELGKNATVYYELIDNVGDTIVSSNLTTNFSSHLSAYNLPTRAPVARFFSNTLSKFSTLNIRQLDPKADQVVVYYKEPGSSRYNLLKEIDLKVGNETTISVMTPNHNPVIYRLIPKNSNGNLVSFEYSNVVLLPRCYSDSNKVSITSGITDSGIEVEVSELPYTTTSVKLLRKNVTLREKYWSIVNSTVNPIFIDELAPKKSYKFFDQSLIPGHQYEYCCDLQHNSGVSKRCGTEIVEYVPKTSGVARLEVKNFKIDNPGFGDINVKFDVSLSLEDTDESIFLSLIDAAGLTSYYASEITDVKSNLNKLLTCRVQRVNMTTGERVDFGVLNKDTLQFSEETLRGDAISPPTRGNVYRYVVSVMARQPDTLFTKIKDATSKTGRAYKFSPRKSRHPAVLKSGTTFTDDGLKKLLNKSELEFGEIGLYAQQDVNLTNDAPIITNISLEQFDRNTNKVSWSFSGNPEFVDHFLVAKRLMGVQTMLGKVHSFSADGKYVYYHNFDEPEPGVLEYVIIPIYSNYAMGDSKLTNPLLVGSA